MLRSANGASMSGRCSHPAHVPSMSVRQCAAPKLDACTVSKARPMQVTATKGDGAAEIENGQRTPKPQQVNKPQLVSQLVREPNMVRRRGLMLAGAATLFGCQCCSDALANAGAAPFEYGGDASSRWPGVCGTGLNQSPINIPLRPKLTSKDKTPPVSMNFKYGRQEITQVVNTGYGTMQVNFKPGNQLYIPPRIIPSTDIAAYGEPRTDDTEPCMCPSAPFNLELLQYHFHTPSEHTVDGEQAPMEAHLVHRDTETGGLAVIAVLLEPGGDVPNACLQLALDSVPTEKLIPRPAVRSVNPSLLLPAKNLARLRPYVHYQGSLTTPPCSESVDWFVMTSRLRVTDKQVLDFIRFAGGELGYGQNARPLQPMNGRELEYFQYEI